MNYQFLNSPTISKVLPKKLMIIGVSGLPHSGKDVVANFLMEKFKLDRHGPSVYVKKATAAMFGIPEAYLYDEHMKEVADPYWGITYREMAQFVGKESSRDVFGDDFWMRHVEKYMTYNLPQTHNGIILPDIRYVNEVEWVKYKGGKMVFINRPGRVAAINETHEADRGLPPELADYVIENNSSKEDLYDKINKLQFI